MRKSTLSPKRQRTKPAGKDDTVATPNGRAAELQQVLGNSGVQQLMSPAPPRAADMPGAVQDGLRTPGQLLDARAGLVDFEHDVADSFDWTAFWVTVGGNVIWATAAFATGGTAFVISLAGIAVATAASAGAVTSPPDFHREAVNRTNDVVTHLNNEVDRVTRGVDFENVPPEVPNLNANLNDVYRTDGRRIDPSVWAIEKRITLTGDRRLASRITSTPPTI